MWGTAPEGRRGQRWAASSKQTRQSAEQPAAAAASRLSAMRGSGAGSSLSAQSSRTYSPVSSVST
eukprot:3733439-Lingulodinium_polyedra.AAC.1